MTPADDDSSLKHDCHSKTQARFSPPLIAADFLRVYPHEDEIGIWLSEFLYKANSAVASPSSVSGDVCLCTNITLPVSISNFGLL